MQKDNSALLQCFANAVYVIGIYILTYLPMLDIIFRQISNVLLDQYWILKHLFCTKGLYYKFINKIYQKITNVDLRPISQKQSSQSTETLGQA